MDKKCCKIIVFSVPSSSYHRHDVIMLVIVSIILIMVMILIILMISIMIFVMCLQMWL